MKHKTIKCKTIQCLIDNIGENLDRFGCGNDFFDGTAKALSMKEISHKLDLVKIKNLCSMKANDKTSHKLGENVCKQHFCIQI